MVVEVSTFRLADGVDEATFLEADRRMQTAFAYAQPGLLRRTTARGTDGRWLVLTLWDSPEDADAASEQAADDEVAKAFRDLVDELRTERYETLD